ncbi:MAG TPA: polysaccharide pyruvyl transferase family protein, partial [Dongiaceae bacterium]|nr:polysaccharide pyruvyl transferase family protein [Dongiaceae bacterium]
ICDPKPYAQQLEETGCDVVLSPRIDGRLEALERLINQIASASLVLAGSLHAAIVACVYGVPFAFYNSGHIDCPFKWIDFAASVGMDAQFVQSVAQYRECIEPSGQRPVLPPVAPLLQRAPFTLRAGCLEKAEAVDRLVTE